MDKNSYFIYWIKQFFFAFAFKKKWFNFERQELAFSYHSIPTRGPSKWPQQEPSAKAEVGPDEPRIDEGVTALDFYNSDLNLVIDADW